LIERGNVWVVPEGSGVQRQDRRAGLEPDPRQMLRMLGLTPFVEIPFADTNPKPERNTTT
jgi:hypothetical protein